METFGAWCEEGDKAKCMKLAGAVAARTNVLKSARLTPCSVLTLSIALQRANARAIQRCCEFTRAGTGPGAGGLPTMLLASALIRTSKMIFGAHPIIFLG